MTEYICTSQAKLRMYIYAHYCKIFLLEEEKDKCIVNKYEINDTFCLFRYASKLFDLFEAEVCVCFWNLQMLHSNA